MTVVDTIVLELNDAEQVFLMNVLTVVVNCMERNGFAQKQPERFRTATCLLLQLQNKTAGRARPPAPPPNVPDRRG